MAWSSTGCSVDTSKQSASTILFCRAGAQSVFQIETEEVSEIRALTESAAKARVPSAASIEDNTTETVYYALIDSLVFSITVRTGSKTEWSAARKDESGQWVARKVVRSYAVKGLDTTIWGTTTIDAGGDTITLSESGVTSTLTREKSTRYIAQYRGATIHSLVTSVVQEVKYIDTLEHAQAIVDAHGGSTVTYQGYWCGVITYDISGGVTKEDIWATCSAPIGTEETAELRYISPSEGYTVTISTRSYSVPSVPNPWATYTK